MFFCTFPFTPGLRIPYDAVVKCVPVARAAVARERKRNISTTLGEQILEKGAIWQQQK
jgi:hypothetical protein